MFTDYHVHTKFSDDSDYLMEDVIKDAIKMNMDEICFTDHVDYGIKRDFEEGCYIEKVDQVNRKRCPLQMWIIQSILKK